MPQLDDGHFQFVVEVCHSITLVINHKLEDSQSPWCFQFVCVSWFVFGDLSKSILVIWIKHSKLELHVISHIWNPFAIFLLINVDEVLNINFSLVVLWVGSIPLVANFVVSDVVNSQHSSFLEVPLGELCAENVVWRALNCVALVWVSCSHEGSVAAHLG